MCVHACLPEVIHAFYYITSSVINLIGWLSISTGSATYFTGSATYSTGSVFFYHSVCSIVADTIV